MARMASTRAPTSSRVDISSMAARSPSPTSGHGRAKPHDRLRDAIGDHVPAGQHRQYQKEDAASDQPGGLSLGAARVLVHGREGALFVGDGAVDERPKLARTGVERFGDLQQLVRRRAAVDLRRQVLRHAQDAVAGGQDLVAGVRCGSAFGAQITGKRGQEARQIAFRILHGRALGSQRSGGVGAQLVHRRPAGEDIDRVYERRRLVAQMLEDADMRHVATDRLLESLIGRCEILPAHAGDADDRQDRQQVSDEYLVANAHIVEEAHRSPVHLHASSPDRAKTSPLPRRSPVLIQDVILEC